MTTLSKTAMAIMAVAVFGVLGLAGFQIRENRIARATMDTRMNDLAEQLQHIRDGNRSWAAAINTDLNAIQSRMEETRSSADSVRKEQAQSAALLRKSMDDHAHAVALQQDKSQAQIRQTVDAKIGALSNRVGRVDGDVDAVKTNVDDVSHRLKSDLLANRRELGQEIVDVRDALGRQIARNADELEILKRGGDFDFYEFDLTKTKDPIRIGGIAIQLTGTDTKANRYDVNLRIDDNKVQKKGQLINEPLQFVAGPKPGRYEMVVNTIDKDRIRGYLSAPKRYTASASNGPIPLHLPKTLD